MKKLLHFIWPLLLPGLLGCDGEFNESKEANILLSKPNGKCEEGSLDPSSEDRIIVDFSWETNEFNFSNAVLEIMENSSPDMVITKEILDMSEGITSVPLQKGKWFTWKITADAEGFSSKVVSDPKEFYSELIFEEDAPFPVKIKIVLENTNEIWFDWNSPIDDPSRDNLRYFTYRSENPLNEENSSPGPDHLWNKFEEDFNSNSLEKRIKIPFSSISQNGNYFFKVESVLTTQDNTELKSNAYVIFNVSAN